MVPARKISLSSSSFSKHVEDLSNQRWLDGALKSAEHMQHQGTPICRDLVHRLLHECTRKKDLELGRRVHSLMVHSGLESAPVLANYLIRLFASCQSLDEANQAFSKVAKPNHYIWSSIIEAHARLGKSEMALQLYNIMQHDGSSVVDAFAISSTLKACINTGAIEHGRRIHGDIVKNKLQSDIVVGSSLLNMYAKCGSLEEAQKLFYELPNRNVVTWDAMITGYAQHGKGQFALDCFENMQRDGMKPDGFTFSNILKACSNEGALDQVKQIHKQVLESGLQSDIVVCSTLVDVYGKLGNLLEAQKVFNELSDSDVVTWSAMVAAYAQDGKGLLAIACFEKMQHEGIKPNKVTFLNVLRACGSVEQARKIHQKIIESKLESDVALGSALVDTYAKSGNLKEARNVFDNLLKRDLVTWSSMISGYTNHNEESSAFQCFEKMQDEGIGPNNVTFLSILKACSGIGSVEWGRCIHAQILEIGLQTDIAVANSLIDMYGKCGDLENACGVFDKLPGRDVVSWGALIASYAQNGEEPLALECFDDMQNECILPDNFVFSNILNTCGSVNAIGQGRLIHDNVIEHDLEWDLVIGSSLVDMYAKCGSLCEARKIFDNLPDRNVFTWGAMIAGYAQYCEGNFALDCFVNLQAEGIKPNRVIFLSILKACGVVGAIEWGRDIHQQIKKACLQSDVAIGNALVDMYAKCGNVDEARQLFERLPSHNVVAWGAMVTGYAQQGNVKLAVQYLQDMQEVGIMPNDIIFASILAACSQAGLVYEGIKYFKAMKEDYGIVSDNRHYNCIVDLLGRAGYLNEAWNLLEIIQPDIISWTSLLVACKTYGSVELGKQCFDQLVELDSQKATGYVLMSGIYSDACMKSDAIRIEDARHDARAWKKPAKAWIEIDKSVHEFVIGDNSHPHNEEILTKLKKLSNHMKEAGYIPKVDLVLHRMPDCEKEDALCGHSERMAIAFGLISTPIGMTIRATKNLRVCMDCHNATKLISKIERREIIIKDAYRMHHFNNGSCSCGDYY